MAITDPTELHYTKKLRILNILNFFVYLIYAIRARIAYMNYSKKLRILISLTIFVQCRLGEVDARICIELSNGITCSPSRSDVK